MTAHLKLPGLDRGRQAVRLRESEAGIQQAIIEALTLLGYVVLSTSEHRRGQTCPRCGQWQVLAGGRGSSKGVPDLLITRPEWPEGVFLGLEVKGPTTRLSPEQRELAAAGRILIVRSIEDAQAALQSSERRLIAPETGDRDENG